MRLSRAFLFAAAAAILLGHAATAAAWPERPLKLVVPYSPGGQFDIVARMVAERMGAALGKPVVVENRPGGATVIGAEYVARAPNDGYTLLYAGANMFAILPHLHTRLPYRRADFQTVSLVNDLPMGLIVNNAVPATDLRSLAAYARANAGKVNFGTSSEAGAQHLLCELIKDKAGIEMQHIGYKGTAPLIQDLLPGRVQVACDGLLVYIPQAKAGRLRILAVSSERRMDALPEVPTFAELGLPEATVASWGGIVAPAGIPAPVLEKLHAAVVAAAGAPEVRSRIASDAAVPHTSTPVEFDAIIQAHYEKWGAVIRKLGLKPRD